MGPLLAHFDLRNAATPCPKFRDERTQRRHRNFGGIARKPT
jgi:hypothetical protein